MTFSYQIGMLELAAVGLFALFYLIFILRYYIIGKKLGNGVLMKIIPKFIIRLTYFSLIIVAIMAPSVKSGKQEIKAIAKDIFIAIDLSESMNATDIQPSRLEKIKFELKKITDAFKTDRIGLIIFSSEAYVQCPLTYDKSAIALFIETLSTGLVSGGGTDFYEPLKLALDKFKAEDNQSKKNAKLIILISDGEDFSENTEDIIDELEDEKIAVFTLGVGTEEGSKIITRRGYKKDKKGNEVISKLNSSALNEVAYKTKGQYYEINSSVNQTEKLINDINRIEGELKESRVVDVSSNRYFYFLYIALGLLAIDLLFKFKVIKL